MQVAKGNPIPENRLGAPRKYPFDKMDIGDSFDIPIDEFVSRAAIYSSARHVGASATMKKIAHRGIYRVWRVR